MESYVQLTPAILLGKLSMGQLRHSRLWQHLSPKGHFRASLYEWIPLEHRSRGVLQRPFSIQVTNCVGSCRICLELRFYGKFLFSLINKLAKYILWAQVFIILTHQPMWDSWCCYMKRDVISLKLHSYFICCKILRLASRFFGQGDKL